MKFGQYLEENQTAEWKKAYIDYKACKKAIKLVSSRLEQVEVDHKDDHDSSDGDADHGPSAPPKNAQRASLKSTSSTHTVSPGLRRRPSSKPSTPALSQQTSNYGATTTSPRPLSRLPSNPPPLDIGEPSVPNDESPIAAKLNKQRSKNKGTVNFTPDVQAIPDPSYLKRSDSPESIHGSVHHSDEDGHRTSDSGAPLKDNVEDEAGPSKISKIVSPRMWGKKSPRIGGSPSVKQNSSQPSPKPSQSQSGRSIRSLTLPSPRISIRTARTFEELYEHLEDDEKAFFDLLDHEMEKVETFYMAREQEAQRRAHDLRDQLRELAEHRRLYHELYPEGMPDWEVTVGKIIPGSQKMVSNAAQKLHFPFYPADAKKVAQNGDVKAGEVGHGQKTLRQAMAEDKDHQTYNPERYQKYRKELKTAVLEYYRYLELIKNYRIMNLTGFRKALKKFEKASKIHCMELYTDERISQESFSSGKAIDDLIKQVEDLFTTHFEHGDSKRARDKLRRQDRDKSHYSTMFRSGIYIGLGFPPAVLALARVTYLDVRGRIPAWEGLLQVYGALYLPLIFAILFELNLAAWVEARINYEFVMELSKPTLDYRSYLEIPSFLFMTLSYCFFFSYYPVAPESVAPTTWPAAWLVFLIVFFINPLPIFRRHARYWLLKVLFRVLTPGYSRVEFIAFFLADELNSLVYTLQSIYFMGCAYANHWPDDIYAACPSGSTWPYALILSLPALARFTQCLKRFKDSRLKIHLINAGKYVSSIAQYVCFVWWRSRGSVFDDASFIVWVIVIVISATYNSAWDLLVDWSLFRPNSGYLRQDLGYSRRWVYYFAIVIDVVIRFIPLWYIPQSSLHTRARSFVFACLEMLRRWQWNFFRVETEHLGNADAYRVTREIPLPYRRLDHDDSEDDKTPSRPTKLSVHLDKIRKDISTGIRRRTSLAVPVASGEGRGPDELNVGPRGHRGEREYEARRPGDLDGVGIGEV